jgi:hypothetical protein
LILAIWHLASLDHAATRSISQSAGAAVHMWELFDVCFHWVREVEEGDCVCGRVGRIACSAARSSRLLLSGGRARKNRVLRLAWLFVRPQWKPSARPLASCRPDVPAIGRTRMLVQQAPSRSICFFDELVWSTCKRGSAAWASSHKEIISLQSVVASLACSKRTYSLFSIAPCCWEARLTGS